MEKRTLSEQEKERYRLWVEYLKESGAYAITCDYLAKCLNVRDYVNFAISYGQSRHEIIEQLRDDVNRFWRFYNFFGDIHDPSYSFDDWWKNEYKKEKTDMNR